MACALLLLPLVTSAQPIETASHDEEIQLRERVQGTLRELSSTGELPSLPAVVVNALTTARDPDAEIEDVCATIQPDVGLVARTLRIANSPAYARRQSCDTLSDAVKIVGLRGMIDLLIAASVRTLCSDGTATGALLWEHSLAVAVTAQELSKANGQRDTGSIFLAGLLHDVGRIAFHLSDPEGFDTLTPDGTNPEPRGSREIERYGFDHALAGGVLAAQWGLPPDVCDAIRCHHATHRAGVGSALAELVNTADALVYTLGIGPTGEPAYPGPDSPLSPDEQAEFAERVRETFETQKTAFA